MKDLNFIKWLLEVDLRLKNAASFLVALVVVVIFFFAAYDAKWFRPIQNNGNVAVSISLVVVFGMAFLASQIIASIIISNFDKKQAVKYNNEQLQLAKQEEKLQIIAMFEVLEKLNDWQRQFITMRVSQNQPQVARWDIGSFEAAWGPEVDVLIAKGIVYRPTREIYEITPDYWKFLKKHLDLDKGQLDVNFDEDY
jgi:hypothetical protein